MVNVALGSSTSDYAEMTIDYTNKTKEFHGLPNDTLYNRIFASFFDWFKLLAPLYTFTLIICGLWWIIFNMLEMELVKWIFGILMELTIITAILTLSSLPLLSLNKKVDKKIKLMFAEKTVKGHKINKITIKKLETKRFIVYDFKNIMLKYEATGQFEKYLDKILIREQNKENILNMQGDIKDMILSDEYEDNIYWKKWNAYFIFKKIPKSGKLEIDFI